MKTIEEQIKQNNYHHKDQPRHKGQPFTLSSGQVSDEYLDIKGAILDASLGVYLAHRVCDAIVATELMYNAIAGVEVGGALLARLVGRELGCPTLLIRKDERTHGLTIHGIDGLSNLESRFNANYSSYVWLCEDVITTGSSTIKAIEKLKFIPGIKLIGIVAVVDREEGGLDVIKVAIPRRIPVIALTTMSKIREN